MIKKGLALGAFLKLGLRAWFPSLKVVHETENMIPAVASPQHGLKRLKIYQLYTQHQIS